MEAIAVHQTIHGYRDGHRLLRASVSLGTDTARTLLLMSDMSGPTMQPGFEEYITGYPLSGTSFYVLAKTWYASEMKRPGCVWTQSLLLDAGDAGKLEEPSAILATFRRPSLEDGESSVAEVLMVPINTGSEGASVAGPAAAVVSELYANKTRPVLLLGDTAAQFEELCLHIWLQQWPMLRTAFSFCTGALAPRVCNGGVLDLQVVPKTVSQSQYRKVAAHAVVIDHRTPAAEHDGTAEVVLDDIGQGSKGFFRRWLRTCAENETSRSLVGRLARIFHFWEVKPPVDPRQVIKAISKEFQTAHPDPVTISRILVELFTLYRRRGGAAREIELLEALAVTPGSNLFNQPNSEIEQRARALITTHKEDCLELLRRLITSSLSSIGQRIVRVFLTSIGVADALELAAAAPHLLPTIVQIDPALACSPDLWSRVSIDRREVLTALAKAEAKTPDLMRGIVDAVIKARAESVAEDLIRVGGEPAVEAALIAIRSGAIKLDWNWKNALKHRAEAVVNLVLHSEPQPTTADLVLVTKLVNPDDAAVRSQCAAIWVAFLERSADQNYDSVVASFGLALGLGQPDHSSLILGFFQPVFDALEANALEYRAWNWIREYAPSVSWWRDWDKCERVAAAVAKRLVEISLPVPEVFRAIRSETAFQQVVSALEAKREGRSYLDAVRRAVASDPGLGTVGQRRALKDKLW